MNLINISEVMVLDLQIGNNLNDSKTFQKT